MEKFQVFYAKQGEFQRFSAGEMQPNSAGWYWRNILPDGSMGEQPIGPFDSQAEAQINAKVHKVTGNNPDLVRLEARIVYVEETFRGRIEWLEREMVRLLWAAMGVLALLFGGFTYKFTVDVFDSGLVAFGCAIVVWLGIGFYLHRHHFRGAPTHIKRMDP